MYHVVIEKQVQKQLAKIPPPNYYKVVLALQDLANNPRPPACKN